MNKLKNTKRGFHGNKIIGLAMFCQMIAITYSIYLFSLFIEPVSAEFGASRATIGLAPPIVFAFSTLLSPLVGRLIDRGHTRRIMLFGAVAMSTGMCLLSVAENLMQAAAIMGLFIGSGAVMLGLLPNSTLIIKWFRRRQGMALAIAASGASIGGFLIPPITSWLIEMIGWRQALLSLGIFSGITLLPAIWRIVVIRPEDIGQTVDGIPATEQDSAVQQSPEAAEPLGIKAIMLKREFWLLTAIIGSLNATVVLLLTTLVPLAIEQGIAQHQAALIFSLMSVAALTGKFLFGYLCDRTSPRTTILCVALTYVLGWPLYFIAPSLAAISAAAVVTGLANGGLMPVSSALIARVFGPVVFASVFSIMRVTMAPLMMIAPPLSGYIFDQFQSYLPLMKLTWFVFPVILLLILLLQKQRNQVS